MSSELIVHYVSGSRADFGLMARCLLRLNHDPKIRLGVIVAGQHLSTKYGETFAAIDETELTVVEKIKSDLSGGDGLEMSAAFGHQVSTLGKFWAKTRPDLVIVLGDRAEMLAASTAAVMLNIHCLHIHGGELSGTIDDRFRHAISKLCHFHAVTSEDAKIRLERMGIPPQYIHNIGAPGLVGIKEDAELRVPEAERYFSGTEIGTKVVCIFHPVVQEIGDISNQMQVVIELLLSRKCRGVLLLPNSDAGGKLIEDTIDKYRSKLSLSRISIVKHLSRDIYLSLLKSCDILIGNSSSGIIESASLGTPCLNIGSRQNRRLRNTNVVDCPAVSTCDLERAFDKAIQLGKTVRFENKFGDGQADIYLANLIAKLPLSEESLSYTLNF